MSRPLTAAELAVFLGLTAAGVRSLIRNHRISPVGKRGRANLYDSRAVIAILGAHDRRFTSKRRRGMAH